MDIKIECPKCKWEPLATSRWYCTCKHKWNTFDTAGVCPNCKKQWEVTQCLRCHEYSPHLDWYKGLDEWLREQLQRIREAVSV